MLVTSGPLGKEAGAVPTLGDLTTQVHNFPFYLLTLPLEKPSLEKGRNKSL